jgi:hypothetical protein
MMGVFGAHARRPRARDLACNNGLSRRTYYIGCKNKKMTTLPRSDQGSIQVFIQQEKSSLFFPLPIWLAWAMLGEAAIGKFVNPLLLVS